MEERSETRPGGGALPALSRAKLPRVAEAIAEPRMPPVPAETSSDLADR